jgi:hypothetical protein
MPYSHTNRKGQTYYLRGKEVTLQNGRKQRIYYLGCSRDTCNYEH